MKILVKFYENHQKNICDLLFYFFASLIPMVLNIASMRIYSLYLSPVDFAIIGFYNAFSLLFTPVISFYIVHNYMRNFFQCSNIERVKMYEASVQLLVYFSAILTSFAIVIIAIYQKMFNASSSIAVYPYALLSMGHVFILGLYNLKLREFKMKKKSFAFFMTTGINSLLVTVLSVIFVYFRHDAVGKFYGTFLGALIIFMYLIWHYRCFLLRKFNFSEMKKIISFCFPLMLASTLEFFSNGYDKVYLERYVSIENLGYYSVGVSISHFVFVFSDAISSTFAPDIFESVAKHNYRKCFKVILLKLLLIILAVIPFILLAPWCVTWLTADKYIDSLPFCIITSLSAITSSLYYSLNMVTIASNHNHIPLFVRILGSILTITMFYYLIKAFGTYGAAWGLVLNYFIYFFCNIILLLFTQKIKTRFLCQA